MAAIVDPARQVFARLRICAALCGLSKTALLAGIFCASVVAQTTKARFTHLSAADGLSDADVRAIAQDRQGFMWFGTWFGGLNRYDGYTFKVYTGYSGRVTRDSEKGVLESQYLAITALPYT